MQILRAMLIWVLALCLPMEGVAANLMTHCRDMQSSELRAGGQTMSHHDHAAKMAMGSMSSTDMSSMSDHHSMHGDSMKMADETAKPGCQCGCDCSGDCLVSCGGMMFGMTQIGLVADLRAVSSLIVAPRGQAHAAYRYDPLRPPSAVAL